MEAAGKEAGARKITRRDIEMARTTGRYGLAMQLAGAVKVVVWGVPISCAVFVARVFAGETTVINISLTATLTGISLVGIGFLLHRTFRQRQQLIKLRERCEHLESENNLLRAAT